MEKSYEQYLKALEEISALEVENMNIKKQIEYHGSMEYYYFSQQPRKKSEVIVNTLLCETFLAAIEIYLIERIIKNGNQLSFKNVMLDIIIGSLPIGMVLFIKQLITDLKEIKEEQKLSDENDYANLEKKEFDMIISLKLKMYDNMKLINEIKSKISNSNKNNLNELSIEEIREEAIKQDWVKTFKFMK